MAKRYVVELTEEERAQLQAIRKKGKVVARRLRRAQFLLLAAEGYTNTEIAKALQVGVSTVERIRRRFVEGGVKRALTERPRPGGTPKLQGKDKALLIATACSTPPSGRTRWALRLSLSAEWHV
jgi:transposase